MPPPPVDANVADFICERNPTPNVVKHKPRYAIDLEFMSS